jgi:23S rRNA (cytidine2498-2'-O)-methyltransferase
VISDNLLIVTAHAEFLDAGIAEMRQFDKQLAFVELLAPGIALCTAPNVATIMRLAAEQHPIFARHLAPVQTLITLTNTEQDVSELAVAMASLPAFERLERGQRFAVQARIIQNEGNTVKRPYSSGYLNQALAEAIIEETGAVESIKKPQIVVSLLCTADKGYLGISLEVFGVTLPSKGRVLDLGAAPGGWTRLLLEAGLQVVAVDPANLDPRLARQPRLEHYRGYAETFLEEAVKTRKSFDLILNDMRMDARDAARLLAQASRCLQRDDGFVISVFKLPHATREIDPLATLRAALALLSRSYAVVQARQLFHNRQEVTVLTAKPLPMRI